MVVIGDGGSQNMTDLDGKFVYVNFLHEHCAPRVGCIYYAGETLEKSQVGWPSIIFIF